MHKLPQVTKLTAAAALAALALGSTAAFAQESSTTNTSVGLEVSSPLYEYTIDPGKVQQDIIKIKNVGSTDQTYYPEVLDFKSDNKSGDPVFLKQGETAGTYSLSKWVSVSTAGIKLSPNQSTAINFNITVPSDAEPGGHYAGILFSTQPPDPSGTNQIGLANKVGSLILVRVSGAAKESAKITEFKTDKTQYDATNVNFSTTVANTGNVHLQPKGVITVKNVFGAQVAAIDVNQLSSNVLPGSTRIFASSWKDSGFRFGYYTATVVLNYGNPSQSMTSQTSFWILPWKTLLIALVVLIVVVLLIYFGIKRYNSWIVSRAQKQTPQQ